MDRVRIGIDLGGTKTEIIALDHTGVECLRQRVSTPQGDYPAILATITELVQQAEQKLACRASVGIGTPGAISPASGLLKNSNSTCLNGKPLLTDLQQAVLVAKVYDEMTFAAVASELDLAISTVKTHYLRAVRAVGDRLKLRWGPEGAYTP